MGYKGDDYLKSSHKIDPPFFGRFLFFYIIGDFLIGVLIFAAILGNISMVISNMTVEKTTFQNRMDAIKGYMVFRKIEGSLENRVIKWFDYLWANKAALDEEAIFNMLPKKLKLEMAMHVHLSTLQKVRIFQDCEESLLGELVMKLKLQVSYCNTFSI